MNILYTITSYPPSIGGAQFYLHEIAKRAIQKHNVSVASFFNSNRNDWLLGTTWRAPNMQSHYEYEGVKVKQIYFTNVEKLRMLPNIITYYLAKKKNITVISNLIEKKIAQENIKIDLIHNVRVGREPLSYASFNLAQRLKVPFFLTPLHHPRWGNRFFKEYHYLYRNADGVFALTPYEKEIYEKLGVRRENIFVTGTGPVLSDVADAEAFRKKYNLCGHLVLFIGQGYRYKGMDKLLKAAKIVFRYFKNVSFIFIGPHTSYSERLFKRVYDPRIIHLGKVGLQEKTDALSACDIFCLPSTQESFGAVFLEAWNFIKPVIGADIPQLRCVINDGVNGYLVRPDPENIASKIINLLRDSQLRKRFGEKGKKLVEEYFTWDILYEKTIRSYENKLSGLKV